METDVLKRNFRQKIKIIFKLYIRAAVVFIFIYILLFFLEQLLIKGEYKQIFFLLFGHKKNILELLVTNFKSISLFFIGIVIASYSIIQALLDEEVLKELTKSINNQTSKFTEINIYFYSYVVLLLIGIAFNGGIEILLKMEKELIFFDFFNFTNNFKNLIFKILIAFEIAFICSIGYEFMIFVRNLYDIFKVSTYIKMTKPMTVTEKIVFINSYLFDKKFLKTINAELTKESYNKMKLLIGKDFTLDEAVKFINEKK
ncbi:hypothetical protein IX317_001651 [Fusobacterium sp. DD29]|uniref:hypothetical protein n=1 Tax=unclassified Fusobacterium TaxID=2648384 RepID=UPI001B8D15C0|nr:MULTISPECIES: hypothetical protein [unclassified Fusobacterium]MBR8749971.1 hypothetical protein [Fusobacterium sp. DD29]MBR8762216.1 hypothetical protein [Fusobacterium sp. DD25]MBR8768230.1 hypothetical protein [Fusobacterium sp. DD43]MBR8772306.1 hypothetical protein [Fusobacterium sp. DD40]MBR8776525.1 hypothetical protein [Fusobacterium sp. DD17]